MGAQMVSLIGTLRTQGIVSPPNKQFPKWKSFNLGSTSTNTIIEKNLKEEKKPKQLSFRHKLTYQIILKI